MHHQYCDEYVANGALLFKFLEGIMKLEIRLGWESLHYPMIEPSVHVTLEGDQELVNNLYEYIMQFKPRNEYKYKEFVTE